ncbi:HK97 gp10 family phage protein [Sphingomonas naphthae]|uniref:HK97 gp10 family phage protein n=1 Tax=Sphingomonas naphthae TaxID=1813468 RepID=A0ABY7TP66_9SPHN|nr:HK97 gp10 family phage protein [Sphingomonas naphthae]WCT75033.1 HK97 gp10 family phage protein [Sphingomonas naphthae]
MTSADKVLAGVHAFLGNMIQNLEPKVLRGALKEGAEVIAAGARENCRSDEVRATIKTSSRAEPGIVVAKVQTKGPGAYMAPWLEHGTDPHFISVDDSQSGGMTVRRINRTTKEALMIGGAFVGTTVFHPGAKPYPFMRPAADTRADMAIEAVAGHITKHLTKEGLAGPAPAAEPDE